MFDRCRPIRGRDLTLGMMLAGLAPLAHAELDARQGTLLANNCLQCHARAGIGAPQMGNPDDWREANQRSEREVLVNVVQGLRGMPPLGYCGACSEADLRALIRVVSGRAGDTK